MKGTYKAVEVSEPGVLRVVERPISEPGPGQVRIRVEACGICHTDAATISGAYPGLTLPRVPGHEVVGRIEALGSGVSRWKIGQRVGVGLIGGEDGVCQPCRRGDAVNCQNPVVLGVTVDGGYAELMIAEARAIASIPDELSSQRLRLSCVRALRLITLYAMRACVAETLWPCRVLAVWGIWASSLRGVWDSIPSRSAEAATRKSSRRISGHTSTSTRPSTTPQRYCSAWEGHGQF